MDLPQLEYFRVLGHLQHVTRAAERLGIAQPTLSRAIARLEDELGVPLFHRIGRSIGLSPYGNVFLGSVERALEELRSGQQRMSEMSSADGGTISLGVLRSLAPQFVPDLTRRFLAVSPGVRFIFTDDSRERLIDALRTGQIALCVTVRTDDKGVEWRAIAQQELVVIVPPDHRFARRATIALAELGGERLVTFKDGYPIRKQIETILRAAGVAPQIVSESDESASVRGLVAAGSGVAIVPRSGPSAEVVTLSITDAGAARAVGLAWFPGRYLSAAEAAFRTFVLGEAARS
jgi:DNA-binding transcriptional LysR family regulator